MLGITISELEEKCKIRNLSISMKAYGENQMPRDAVCSKETYLQWHLFLFQNFAKEYGFEIRIHLFFHYKNEAPVIDLKNYSCKYLDVEGKPMGQAIFECINHYIEELEKEIKKQRKPLEVKTVTGNEDYCYDIYET